MVATQAFVRPKQLPLVLGHVVQRCCLALHHVRVEVRRTTHRLARVVDDEVETRARGEKLATEGFDAGRVTEIETEDLEAMAPGREVRLAGVTMCRVAREARRDDQVRPAAQQLQTGLIADLHAAAREERHPSGEVRQLSALVEVQLGAGGTELIVEVMDDRVLLLADVAVLQLSALSLRLWAFVVSGFSRTVVHVLRLETVGYRDGRE